VSVEEDMRAHIVEVLDFIADEGAQRAYQVQAPGISVGNELFNMWDDCYPPPESVRLLFTAPQLAALARFHTVLNEVADMTPDEVGPLGDFVHTNEWRRLNQAARLALKTVMSANTRA
jgi:hypothetical protein